MRPKIKRRVSNAEIPIALSPNALFGLKRRNGKAISRQAMQKGNRKVRKGRVKGKSAHFACLEGEELGPESEEIPAQEVNFVCRYINSPNTTRGNGCE